MHVTPLPPPAAPPIDPNAATDEQWRELVELAKRVPPKDRFAILDAKNKKTDLTERQRMDWAIKEFREYIRTKNPGPVVDPLPPTKEECETAARLSQQVPEAERLAIIKEASNRRDLEGREQILWITEQFRNYIESHKSSVNEKNPSDGKRGPKRPLGRTEKE